MFWHDFEPYTYRNSFWYDLDRLQNEINKLFSTSGRVLNTEGYPAVNAWSNENGLKLTAKLPGISTENLNVSVEGATLTISGSREAEKTDGGEEFHRQERSHGSFSRTFTLPFRVDQANAKADHKDGTLTLTLPGCKEDMPKKIEIKAA